MHAGLNASFPLRFGRGRSAALAFASLAVASGGDQSAWSVIMAAGFGRHRLPNMSAISGEMV